MSKNKRIKLSKSISIYICDKCNTYCKVINISGGHYLCLECVTVEHNSTESVTDIDKYKSYFKKLKKKPILS